MGRELPGGKAAVSYLLRRELLDGKGSSQWAGSFPEESFWVERELPGKRASRWEGRKRASWWVESFPVGESFTVGRELPGGKGAFSFPVRRELPGRKRTSW